jgi:very-short-patch-repair endonuclease
MEMVKYEHPPLATPRARAMRRDATDAEKKLWLLLRDRRLGGAKFRRQVPIGPYIVDFICLRRKLVIEADGGQHMESRRDAVRDRWLADEGYNVVRYTNIDILKNPDGVLLDVLAELAAQNQGDGASPSPGLGSLRSPRPPSPPLGRGKRKRSIA